MPTNQAALTRLINGVRSRLSAHVDQYAEDGNAEALGYRMIGELVQGHAQGVIKGRNLAGDDAPQEADDAKFAWTVIGQEHPYLDSFVEDLKAGRYAEEDGSLDTAAVKRRARLYASRIVGTANSVFAIASPDHLLFYWNLGDAEHSCEDCPELAANSPYTADTLPTQPGENKTQCLSSCRCVLVRSDGVEAFTIPDDH